MPGGRGVVPEDRPSWICAFSLPRLCVAGVAKEEGEAGALLPSPAAGCRQRVLRRAGPGRGAAGAQGSGRLPAPRGSGASPGSQPSWQQKAAGCGCGGCSVCWSCGRATAAWPAPAPPEGKARGHVDL